MDQKTEILISLASSAAANCIPCFDHYFQQAKTQKLKVEDVEKTMEIAAKIKGAAAMFTKKAIETTMGTNSDANNCQCHGQANGAATESCC